MSMTKVQPTSQHHHLKRLKGQDIILFGAGTLGREMAQIAHAEGLNVVGFADETSAKQGKKLEGVEINTPNNLQKLHPNALWVVCVFLPFHSFVKTKAKLEGLGIKNLASFYEILRAYPQHMPKYFFDMPENYDAATLDELRNVLSDEASKETLKAFEDVVSTGEFSVLPYHEFLKDNPIQFTAAHSFLDAGAYNGDTLKAFIKLHGLNFNKYIALEPDSQNFNELEAVAISNFSEKGGGIIALNAALWKEDGTIFFDAQGNTASSINESAINCVEVSTRCLDSLFKEYELDGKTCIKFDVEGAELVAIQAAEHTISTHKPPMMISVYHKPHDLTQIYNVVKGFNPNYRYALRCHAYDGADLMLYCF